MAETRISVTLDGRVDKGVQQRMRRQVELSADLLRSMKITPEAWFRVAVNALVTNPELAECTPESLDREFLRCLQAGLLPDGREAGIGIFRRGQKREAQLMVMIDGREKLTREAMPGITIRSRCVYRDDEFEHREGLEPVLRHEPAPDADQSPQNLVAVYAIAKLPGGGEEWAVLYPAEVARARAKSPNAQRGAWATDTAAMWEKTARHRLQKRFPRRPTDPPDWDEVKTTEPESGPRIVGPALPAPAEVQEAEEEQPEKAVAPEPDEEEVDESGSPF